MIFPRKSFIGLTLVIFSLIICSYYFFDLPLACFLKAHSLPHWANVLINTISDLGVNGYYLIFLPIIAIVSFNLKNIPMARACVFLFLCVAFSGLVCGILKVILGRARPDEFFHFSQYGFYWFQTNAYKWSFPSGHTTSIWSLMFGLCVIKPRWSKIFICIAIAVSFTRIILTRHYFSDVLAGFYLAFVCVHMVRAFYQRKRYNFGSLELSLRLQK